MTNRDDKQVKRKWLVLTLEKRKYVSTKIHITIFTAILFPQIKNPKSVKRTDKQTEEYNTTQQ